MSAILKNGLCQMTLADTGVFFEIISCFGVRGLVVQSQTVTRALYNNAKIVLRNHKKQKCLETMLLELLLDLHIFIVTIETFHLIENVHCSSDGGYLELIHLIA